MKTPNSSTQTLIASAALAARSLPAAGAGDTCAQWLTQLQSQDEHIRSQAWFSAGQIGAAGISGLPPLITDPNIETSRAATRALRQIVHYAGRPAAGKERKAVVKALLPLLNARQDQAVRVAAVGGLSEIAGDEAVKPIAAMLSEPEVREAARMALERIPGEKSLAAMRNALAHAPDDFKPILAQSIRSRGGETPGVPDAKLVPCRATQVEPVSTANKS